jgi:hypothetical protein
MPRECIGVLAAACLLIGVSACDGHKSAANVRRPTPKEMRDLEATVRERNDGQSERLIATTVSLSDPTYASVHGASGFYYFFHRRGPSWATSYRRNAAATLLENFLVPKRSAIGACAFAPATVIHDLYRIKCPPERALHARRASARERSLLRATFLRSRATIGMHLERVCISRLDPSWAAAEALSVDTGWTVWFHDVRGRWGTAKIDFKNPARYDAVLLSLASCAGYSYSEFGDYPLD